MTYGITRLANDATGRLGLVPAVRERAIALYGGAVERARLRSIEIPNQTSLMGTCLYLAMQEAGPAAGGTVKKIIQAFRILGHRLSFQMIHRDAMLFDLEPGKHRITHGGADHVDAVIDGLRRDQAFNARFNRKVPGGDVGAYFRRVKDISTRILGAIPPRSKASRNPANLAGAAVYGADRATSLETGQSRVLTRQLLAGTMGIGEFSIGDAYCNVVKPLLDVPSILSSLGVEPPTVALKRDGVKRP